MSRRTNVSSHVREVGEITADDWKEFTFSSVIKINNYPKLEKGKKHPYVGMKQLDKNKRKITETIYKQYKNSGARFKNGDTLFARITPCLEQGKTAFVDILEKDEVAFGSTEFIVMSATEKILPKFVYYTARRPDVRQFAIKRMTGTSGRQRVPNDIFDNLKIKIPPIEEQEKIVEFLDSLDALIEANNKINQVLEETAQTIFKSWFVDFEHLKYSEPGRIPENFTKVKLPFIADIILGGTPDTKNPEYWNGSITWARAKDISNETQAFISKTEKSITQKGVEESSAKMVPEGTTVITARGTVGETVISPIEMAINQTCYGLAPKNDNEEYLLYFLVKTLIEKLKSRTHGTVFDTITKRTLKEQEIALPPKAERKLFNNMVSPLMEKIKKNQMENKNLSSMRDNLLPKLMSGEIRVIENGSG